MVNVKEMSYKKKYKMALENIELFGAFVPSFLKANLNNEAVETYQMLCREGIKMIPEDAEFKEKYNIAYNNFIWIGKSNFNFIRKHMGEDGIKKFERAEVEALKRKNAGPAIFFLGLVRAFSPAQAFVMTNKEFSYQLQWLTPFSVSEISKKKTVFNIPSCKVLDFQDTEDICKIGCQKVYPTWVAEQFKANMAFDRQDKECTCTITPQT